MDFKELYEEAFKTSKETYFSKDLEVGSVGCAIFTETNHLYLGKNLDMSSSIGMCAERNAISSMLTYEVSKITKMACVHKSGKIILPCGACREFMKQLEDLTVDTEILVSLEPFKVVKLNELLPSWWRDDLKKN